MEPRFWAPDPRWQLQSGDESNDYEI
jgi:hypothetical protein